MHIYHIGKIFFQPYLFDVIYLFIYLILRGKTISTWVLEFHTENGVNLLCFSL